jgi:two-component system, NarL family, nitrate/nitrite response regulator NarL
LAILHLRVRADVQQDSTAAGAMSMTVAIVDDHRLISAALRVTLEGEGFSVLVPDLADRAELVATLLAAGASVVLLDLDLGSFGNGGDLLPDLVAAGVRVIVMSGTADDATAGRCLAAGAWGWVAKSAMFDRLLSAVVEASAGRPALPEAERERLVRAWRAESEAVTDALEPFEALTQREVAVLEMLRTGMTVERIASDSFVSEATVRTQVRAVLSKLGVHSQLEAVALANRSGWLPPAG